MDLLALAGSVPGGPSRLHRSERCMAGFPTKDRSHARDPTRPAARGFFVLHAGVGHGVRPTETGLIWVRPRRGLVSCVWCEWCVPTVRSYYMIEACPPLMSSLFSLLPQTLFQRASISSPIFSLVFCLFLRVQSHSLLCSRFPFQTLAAISDIQQTITTTTY